jgi:hypothetical protein
VSLGSLRRCYFDTVDGDLLVRNTAVAATVGSTIQGRAMAAARIILEEVVAHLLVHALGELVGRVVA